MIFSNIMKEILEHVMTIRKMCGKSADENKNYRTYRVSSADIGITWEGKEARRKPTFSIHDLENLSIY